MPLDVLLLILKVMIALSLYGFIGVLGWMLWKDVSSFAGERLSGGVRAVLEVTQTHEEVTLAMGTRFIIYKEATIGRSPANTIYLPDSYASTHHAIIATQNNALMLRDNQSRNGTLLNGAPISDGVILSHGDEIGIGRVTFYVSMGGADNTMRESNA